MSKTMIFKLKELMDARNITQVELRDATGLATTTIGRIAGNRATRVDIDTIERLVNYFDLKSISELMEVKEVK